MDLTFTAEQAAQRASLRSLLATRCPLDAVEAWEASELGFSAELFQGLAREGRLAPDALLDLSIRFEELGSAATPGPFLAHLEALLVLQQIDARAPLLDATGGPGHVCLAHPEAFGPGGRREPSLECERTRSGGRLVGTLRFVPFANSAKRFLVVARLGAQGERALLSVDPAGAGIERISLASLGPERLFEVRFDGTCIELDDCLSWDVGAALAEATARATLLVCAELAGAARGSLDCAVAHARIREQFGRPIGAFQAVAHHCANMALDVDAAQLAVWEAASRIDAGEPPALHASRAKVVCSEAARRVTATAHQVMGGVGFLAETGLHHWTRRVKALESRLGTPDWHRERLADALSL